LATQESSLSTQRTIASPHYSLEFTQLSNEGQQLIPREYSSFAKQRTAGSLWISIGFNANPDPAFQVNAVRRRIQNFNDQKSVVRICLDWIQLGHWIRIRIPNAYPDSADKPI
jgi:hypothetical protein